MITESVLLQRRKMYEDGLKTIDAQMHQLAKNREATAGAIQDINFWIDTLQENIPEVSAKGVTG